ncbi:lytic transglycosylase domain-containing protein (plasmid) [Stutzerimonas frequens]|uniref:lytic transglycosylase domain-containing protein n=1 Tax=Stutzerimonas frequens TaxID=2968969 RepID=UPI002DBDA2C3|nr:lytic transglycosylase domain-containing protein [Stutzerimonas frequens]WRW29458.1 lytic transglycosylase domain-containing protein [Stutzerimonas frequens]
MANSFRSSALASAAFSALMLIALPAHSNSSVKPLTSECLKTVAQEYEIHPDVLLALLIVEGGTVGQNSRANKNGSYDIGLFQINTIHREDLAAIGVSEESLRNDGCLNAAVAGWHLRRVLTSEVMATVTDDESYLRALARYHSATPEYNEIYADKLRTAFAYLYQHSEQ